MTLGKQFENTFWHDDDGGITASVRNEGFTPPVKTSKPLIQKLSNDSGNPNVSGTPLQGMLFHPSTATGHRDDPLVPHETRMSAIRTALDINDVTKYRRNLGQLVPSQRVDTYKDRTDKEGNPVINPKSGMAYSDKTVTSKQSAKSAQGYMGMLADTLDNTDYPTHEIQKTTAQAVVDPRKGRAHAESFGQGIKMNIIPGGKVTSWEAPPSNRYEPDTTKPVHNPKFWGQLGKQMDDKHEYTSDQVISTATHWHNPTTGHTLHQDDVEDWAEKHPEARGRSIFVETAAKLKEQGYFPNLFPGKGEHGIKHSAGDTHDIEVGYGNSDYQQYRTRKYHTRFEPDPSNPLKAELVPVTKTNPPRLNEGTLVHEIGHNRDPNTDDKYHIWTHHKDAYADPMLEGVADGFQDRHSRYAGQFDDVLSHSDDRVNAIQGTSYSTNYGNWKNNTHRALYAATRFHSALGDTNFKDIPSRENLSEDYLTYSETDADWHRGLTRNTTEAGRKHGDLVNTLALGHIYEHQPHVREHLDAHGYGGVAKKAHAEYLDRAKKRGTLLSGNQFEDHKVESSQLPGLENY
jgi:hypothetical protein